MRAYFTRNGSLRGLTVGPWFFAVERWPPGIVVRFHIQGPRFAVRLAVL